MSFFKTNLLVLFFLIQFLSANAQVSENLQKDSLETILNSLATERSIQFYYKKEWIDTVFVTYATSTLPITNVLSNLFLNTNVRFVKISDKQYAIAPSAIATYLTSDTSQWNAPKKDSTFNKFYTLQGTLQDNLTNKALEGATIEIPLLNKGTVSDKDGKFELLLPSGKHRVSISYIGYKKKHTDVIANKDVKLILNLEVEASQLAEVQVYGIAQDNNVRSAEIGMTRLSMMAMKKLPSFMGETDVIKTILLLPGVTTVGEGSSGFYVRGSGVDQNLILFDEAPIYYTGHLFGMFSIFHPDFAKDITLYKGGIPAKYGGRIASVLDVKSKEGNFKKFSGRGGLSVVSNRLSLEGPIVKDKLSFNFSTRVVYADWFLKLSKNPSLNKTQANFQDYNLRLDYRINEKQKLSLSNYYGRDYLKLNADSLSLLGVNGGSTVFNYSNMFSSLKWMYFANEKLTYTSSAVFSRYQSKIINPDANPFEIKTAINNSLIKSNVEYAFQNTNKIVAGVEANLYDITPGSLLPLANSTITPLIVQKEKGLETGLHIMHDWQIIPLITIAYGTRFSTFAKLGPSEDYIYKSNLPLDESTITDTIQYNDNQVVKQYSGFEPRATLRIRVNERNSFKINYNRTRQYLQLVSNTTSSIPTDRWKLSDNYVKPQIADQYAVGFFRNSISNQWELSWELYYKDIKNTTDYKGGSQLLLNRTLETSVLQGIGKAYGSEWLVRKTGGKLTGFASYSYARSYMKIAGATEEETVNNGDWYAANVDKPHNVNVALAWQVSRRWNLAANFTYSTGRPITFPTSKYTINGVAVLNYENRNQQRIPDYHRLDISITFEPNLSKNKKWDSSWNFSIFNLYGRRNPFSVYFKANGANAEAYQLSILGVAFPSLTYNFKF